MKKTIVILALTALAAAPVSAQRYSMTGDMILSAQHEVMLGVGVFPATDFNGVASFLLNAPFDVKFDGRTVSSAINMSYSYRLSDMLSVGGAFSFTTSSGKISDAGDETGDGIKNYYSIMPQAKFSWFRSGIVTLYSRVNAGVLVATFDRSYVAEEKPDTSDSAVSFAFHVAPIGIELGRDIAGYAEAGFGSLGTIQVGIRYRF